MIDDDGPRMWLRLAVGRGSCRIEFRRIDPRSGRTLQRCPASFVEATTFVTVVSLTTGDPSLSNQLSVLRAIADRCRGGVGT